MGQNSKKERTLPRMIVVIKSKEHGAKETEEQKNEREVTVEWVKDCINQGKIVEEGKDV